MCWMCHVRVVPLIDRTWSHVLCIGVDPGLGSQSLVTLSVVVGVVVDEHGMPLDLILPHNTLVLSLWWLVGVEICVAQATQ